MSEIKYKQKNKKNPKQVKITTLSEHSSKITPIYRILFFTIADLHCKSSGKRKITLASSKYVDFKVPLILFETLRHKMAFKSFGCISP